MILMARLSPVSVSQRVFVIERAVIRIVLDFMICLLSSRWFVSKCHPLTVSPTRVSVEVSKVN